MNIYVDYTHVYDLERNVGAYIGAGNYTREIIPFLVERGANVRVIVHEDFDPDKDWERELLESGSMLIRSKGIVETDFSECDVLFLPATNGHHLSKIRKIRKKNRDLKIYVVIHDKQHGIVHFDPMDRFFYEDIRRLLPVSYAVFLVKKVAFNILYPGYIKCVDKVFTVSNNSVQALSHKNLKRITYLYQPSSIADYEDSEPLVKKEDQEKYILFVSGGRPDKNLGRALLAFREYCDRDISACKMYITGIEREKLYYLAWRLKIDSGFIDERIVAFDYVDTCELAKLYRNCRYLLFVSKGEGFGLPVLEAIRFGKTVLCSWQSSIPEVAGSILYYVNAYDVSSILQGMLYLDDDKNLRYREAVVAQKRKIINEQIELDKMVLIHEITEQTDDR